MNDSTHSSVLPRGLVTALRTLTLLPVAGDEADTPADALPWFPVVGALLGILTWGLLAAIGHFVEWSNGLALLAVAFGVFLTRGLHLDGLADAGDAFWGGHDRARMLAIMKDSALGTFGTTAIVLVLIAKWCSIALLIDAGTLHWLIVAMVASRAIQVDLAVKQPYAREEGGTGHPFVDGATQSHWMPAAWTAIALVVIFGGFAIGPCIALLAAFGFGRWFGGYCHKRVGGVTGDLLGTGSELTETIMLLLGAALSTL